MKYLVRQQNQAKSQSRRFKVTEVIFKDGTLRLREIIFIGGFFKPMFLHGSKYVVVVFFWQAKDMREEGLLYFTYVNEEIGLF